MSLPLPLPDGANQTTNSAGGAEARPALRADQKPRYVGPRKPAHNVVQKRSAAKPGHVSPVPGEYWTVLLPPRRPTVGALLGLSCGRASPPFRRQGMLLAASVPSCWGVRPWWVGRGEYGREALLDVTDERVRDFE